MSWSAWSGWGACIGCGTGAQLQTRTCSGTCGSTCTNGDSQTNTQSCIAGLTDLIGIARTDDGCSGAVLSVAVERVVGLLVSMRAGHRKRDAAVSGLVRLAVHRSTVSDTDMHERHGECVEQLVVVDGVQCDVREWGDDATAHVWERDVRDVRWDQRSEPSLRCNVNVPLDYHHHINISVHDLDNSDHDSGSDVDKQHNVQLKHFDACIPILDEPDVWADTFYHFVVLNRRIAAFSNDHAHGHRNAFLNLKDDIRIPFHNQARCPLHARSRHVQQ